ncbi:DUF6455 family protein [Mameliella alba]|uniref:DUF6455 family protein n=1 Tax=Mameliella alba TaxID=561184 RepID=UPI0035E7F017
MWASSRLDGVACILATRQPGPGLDAFQTRIYLRRRMMRVSGIDLPKRRLSDSLESDIRDSMINCHKCNRAAECLTWVTGAANRAADAATIPKFCVNREIFERLKTVR